MLPADDHIIISVTVAMDHLSHSVELTVSDFFVPNFSSMVTENGAIDLTASDTDRGIR